MQTTFLGLRTVVYKVGNITDAKAWYSRAFRTEPYFDQPFYVGYNIAGYELGLHPEDDQITQKSDGAVAYWGVDNVEDDYSRMLSLGAFEHEKPTNVGGGIIVAGVRDPWGNVIGLIYNPDFKL